MKRSLCKKCPYSEFFWSVFSHIRTEYGEIGNISSYSVQMRENANQKKSEYFSRSEYSRKSLITKHLVTIAATVAPYRNNLIVSSGR